MGNWIPSGSIPCKISFSEILIIFRIIFYQIFLKCLAYFLVRNPEHFSGVIILSSAAVIALLAIYFSLSSAKFTWVKITLISTVLSIYLFEGYIFIAKGSSRFFYPTLLHKVLDYRSKGVDAHPMIYPGSILTEFERNGAFKILPVGGVPDTRTVNCHENDGIVSYQSDQFGFNNPVGTWQEQVTFAFVGDSYVHGFCMQNPNKKRPECMCPGLGLLWYNYHLCLL